MCRYIINDPDIKNPEHEVTTILGNGLKKDVWVEFVKKFKIKNVYEFYTGSEGVVVLANLDSKVGAIGFIPRYLQRKHTTQIIQYDEETEQPIFDDNGYCMRCKFGQSGLAIGKIVKETVLTNFEGYSDREQTNWKILRNVFQPGDMYYNTGDIMVSDELGYIYFKDRIGDTYRWKGENVSALEVETVIGKITDNINAVVFGVKIPGTEGRCGMVVLADPHSLVKLDTLGEKLFKNLPKYAIPLFLRIVDSLPMTSTFKVRKVELKLEGYNLDMVNDPLYFFSVKQKQVSLLYLMIVWNTIKLGRNSVYTNFNRVVKKYPHKVLFYYEDEIWTSLRMKKFTNKIAYYFEKEGFRKGDTIALMMENKPEYLCVCNFNEDVITFENTKNLRQDLEKSSNELLEERVAITFEDPLFYIYTSGTTGLPKAVIITHERFNMVANLALVIPSDAVIYCPLPLYHTSGGMLGVGPSLVHGVTVALRKKFSASNYFKDCEKYQCTVGQYVGEMCRYILASADGNVKHPVKIMLGNGLKTYIWKEFMEKFKIEHMYEFYGATEGNVAFINLDNKVGSVGCVPLLLRNLQQIAIVRVDRDTGEPIRDRNGRCIRTVLNEPGLLIVKLRSKIAVIKFTGYTDEQENKKKILYDVFTSGDRYYNSGDMFTCDKDGYFYFVDRIGDTFRWKSENVSTSEVEAVISKTIGLKDVVVYGVEVPDNEGKAGMVALNEDGIPIDLTQLCKGLKENLPKYAIPIFIRVTKSVPVTGTYKLQKIKLRSEGFNINDISDPLYFYNYKTNTYDLLNVELYQQIMEGKIRL
ncbi:hypothetical protein FQA39_LY14169 [Lamprigera yunnana]|nr:hypothetical protein FQA39_LY14169 [Lamprigera yunnana]